MDLQVDKKKIFTILLITAILAITPLMTARADPPGSPPYGAYVVILGSDKEARNFVGDKVQETISFNIPFSYGSQQYSGQYIAHIEAASQASIYGASAIAAAFDYQTHKLIGAGGNGYSNTNTYNGYTCQHMIVITDDNYKKFSIHRTQLGLSITYTYIIKGYYWKTGWGCRDTKIPFSMNLTSYHFVYNYALNKNQSLNVKG